MFTIEDLLPFFRVEGEAHLHEGGSADGLPSRPPVNIIQDDQTLYVHFRWKHEGFLGWLIDTDCKWILRIYFEKMGTAETPADPAPVAVSYKPGNDESYSRIIPVNGLTPGVYKVVVSMTLQSPSGTVTPFAAHEEIGYLQVYQDNA